MTTMIWTVTVILSIAQEQERSDEEEKERCSARWRKDEVCG